MSTTTLILEKQSAWAVGRGIALVGSEGARGRRVYATALEDNLFQPLSTGSRQDIARGDGGELSASGPRAPKMHALHSSSALGVNVFDYWRSSDDLSTIAACCGFVPPGTDVRGEVRFEQKYTIDAAFPRAPNIDVVLVPESGVHGALAIECKFTEAYGGRGHGGLAERYLGVGDLWDDLKATYRLAQSLVGDAAGFSHLHPEQLIKHILGLTRSVGRGRFRLMYLWYDVPGEDGVRNRDEVERFTDVVGADGVGFHAMTYQELIARLGEHRSAHQKYVDYLTERYL